MNKLLINSTDADGNQYEITYTPGKSRNGVLSIREWDSNRSIRDPASNSNSYQLSNVHIYADRISCDTSAMFMTPHIEVALKDDRVDVAISHTLFKDGVTSYSLSKEAVSNVKSFLAVHGGKS